jgi:hypothetical protein
MRKTLAILLAATTLVTATAANADWNGHRHYGGGGYNHGGGGNAGMALFGGLVGGMILGGMINNMNQQQYYPQPQYYQPQTFCRLIPVYDAWGNYVGRQRQCWQQ